MVVASLKVVTPRLRLNGSDVFPRLHGRGLIEGCRTTTALWLGASFHDCMVVASLKAPVHARHHVERLGCFHDCMVVASLKGRGDGEVRDSVRVSTTAWSWPH